MAATHERVQITKNGREHVVLLAAEDLESVEATLELLDDPGARSRSARAEEEIERGDVRTRRRFARCSPPGGPDRPSDLPGRRDPDGRTAAG